MRGSNRLFPLCLQRGFRAGFSISPLERFRADFSLSPLERFRTDSPSPLWGEGRGEGHTRLFIFYISPMKIVPVRVIAIVIERISSNV
jgi:hypothetical protein